VWVSERVQNANGEEWAVRQVDVTECVLVWLPKSRTVLIQSVVFYTAVVCVWCVGALARLWCLSGLRIARQLRVFGPKAREQSTDRRGACVTCTRPVMKKTPTTPPATRPSAAQHPGENGAGAGAASAAQTGVVAVTCECGRQFASGQALGGHRKRCNNGVQSPPAAESAHGAGKNKQKRRGTSAKEAAAAANAKGRGGAHTTSVRAGSLGSPRIAHLANPLLAICIPAASIDLALTSVCQPTMGETCSE